MPVTTRYAVKKKRLNKNLAGGNSKRILSQSLKRDLGWITYQHIAVNSGLGRSPLDTCIDRNLLCWNRLHCHTHPISDIHPHLNKKTKNVIIIIIVVVVIVIINVNAVRHVSLVIY